MVLKDFRSVVGLTEEGCGGATANARLALVLPDSALGGSGADWGVYAAVGAADVGVTGGRASAWRIERGNRVLGSISDMNLAPRLRQARANLRRDHQANQPPPSPLTRFHHQHRVRHHPFRS
jgi:hypothetical protein